MKLSDLMISKKFFRDRQRSKYKPDRGQAVAL
jgi:hypothetical protein